MLDDLFNTSDCACRQKNLISYLSSIFFSQNHTQNLHLIYLLLLTVRFSTSFVFHFFPSTQYGRFRFTGVHFGVSVPQRLCSGKSCATFASYCKFSNVYFKNRYFIDDKYFVTAHFVATSNKVVKATGVTRGSFVQNSPTDRDREWVKYQKMQNILTNNKKKNWFGIWKFSHAANDITLTGKIWNAKVTVFCLSERPQNSASYDVFIDSLARSVGELWLKLSQNQKIWPLAILNGFIGYPWKVWHSVSV